MRVKSILYISPMAKSLDKARGEQKAVRRGGAIEGVLGFSLSEDSWASVSGSVSMLQLLGSVCKGLCLQMGGLCPLGCIHKVKRMIDTG